LHLNAAGIHTVALEVLDDKPAGFVISNAADETHLGTEPREGHQRSGNRTAALSAVVPYGGAVLKGGWILQHKKVINRAQTKTYNIHLRYTSTGLMPNMRHKSSISWYTSS
jgi:hypothetical protein